MMTISNLLHIVLSKSMFSVESTHVHHLNNQKNSYSWIIRIHISFHTLSSNISKSMRGVEKFRPLISENFLVDRTSQNISHPEPGLFSVKSRSSHPVVREHVTVHLVHTETEAESDHNHSKPTL